MTGGERDEIDALGLDFGDSRVRVEAVREDGSFVWSNLSTFGQSLADKSARNPGGWKHDGGFHPWKDAPGKKGPRNEISAYDEAMSRMFAPILLDFRS
jgi:hypothetical protein